MWVDTYPYVRLHQPHPMFTAGNIAGTIGRRPSYLPTKGEVLEHFSHCLAEIGKRLTIDERYGWDLTSDEPSADGNVMDFDRWYPWPRDGIGAVRTHPPT